MKYRITYFFFIGMLFVDIAFGQKKASADLLVSFVDTTNKTYGYRDLHGKVVIPTGKYDMCFTDTFRAYAIVLLPHVGFVGIDRKENILYKVFPFDNGPDYVQDGLFRITKAGKIGYADAGTGKIVIQPTFTCAWPFENGKAMVSMQCERKYFGEHWTWISNKWFYIDKKGRTIKAVPAQDK